MILCPNHHWELDHGGIAAESVFEPGTGSTFFL